MRHLQDLDLLVLGLGESGLAMARWCARHGARVRVWDSRMAPPQAEALRSEWPAVPIDSGQVQLGSAKLVLKSPGLAPHDARIAPLLAQARGIGIAVQAELDLFVHALADLKAEHDYAPKLIAITGTNGKTTTTAMTGLLVERAGKRVAVAGNIKPTLLDRLGTMLEAPREEWAEAWVLELSSFQLADSAVFEPDAAALLNLTQDHLDWHGDMRAYGAAKARVFGERALIVANRDDAAVMALVPTPTTTKNSRGKSITRAREQVHFGLGAPTRAGDFGLVSENGMAWLVRALPPDDPHDKAAAAEAPHLQRLMPADALRIRGRHNAANALAALALATGIGCPLAPMLHGLREYAGEPHRVAFVASVGGVEAFDDSKGTNVGATVAALQGLGRDKAPHKLVLILGGDGKGQDFSPLLEPVREFVRAAALIGRDAGRLRQALEAAADGGIAAVALADHATLEAAVRWCFEQAHEGDAVLLSPACASLDMFRNYGHRGEAFADAVRALAAERGEAL